MLVRLPLISSYLTFQSHHCVCLARAGLTVSKDCGRVALEGGVDELMHATLLENFDLLSVITQDRIEPKLLGACFEIQMNVCGISNSNDRVIIPCQLVRHHGSETHGNAYPLPTNLIGRHIIWIIAYKARVS